MAIEMYLLRLILVVMLEKNPKADFIVFLKRKDSFSLCTISDTTLSLMIQMYEAKPCFNH